MVKALMLEEINVFCMHGKWIKRLKMRNEINNKKEDVREILVKKKKIHILRLKKLGS